MICVAVGAIIGLEQAFVLIGRISPDPTSVIGPAAVGIRVSDGEGARLVRAKQILTRFSDQSERQKRWWMHRRWAHQIGT